MQYLGQHFLINTSAPGRIIDALELKKGETVIEIGPGQGALTIPLAKRCEEIGCELIAIEKDMTLSADLQHVKIIFGDALIELPKLTEKLINYKIVGNIPYYITGHLLRTIGELEHKPLATVLMIQKEVAQRVTAKPPEMNLLAAATQIWADTELLFKLNPQDFDPPPQVHSAVIKLTTHEHPVPELLKKYYAALHVIFKQPRKTILNNLSEIMEKNAAQTLLTQYNIDPRSRPQDLAINQIAALADSL